MKTIKTLPIGTEVWYFDPVLNGDIEIIKSVVLGSYINKNEGELYYNMISNHAPAWCVSDTEEGIQILKRAFLNYREKLHEANAQNKQRYNTIREGTLFEEYEVDNLPEEEKVEEHE
jgi:hypothetical protein